jgi:hypothetical protein
MVRSRLLAASIALVLIATALAGCVKNLPNPAADWLAGRDGVVEAHVLADNTGAWSSSGLVRGELDPDIDDTGIARLVEEVQAYQAEVGAVAFWLGWHGIDFSVSDVDSENTAAVALWHELVVAPGVKSGVVVADEIRARALRGDTVEAFAALRALDAGVRIESFSDQQTLDTDYIADTQYQDEPNPLAFEFRRPKGCDPAVPVVDYGDSLVERDDIPGGVVDLCAGITLDLPATASLATEALALRADLDARGLSDFTVQLVQELDAGTHFAAVTPGDPAVLPVLGVFEQPGAPPVSYSLGPDGNLAVTSYGTPTGDLLTLMQSAPAADKLIGIGLEGDPVAILGPLERLPSLLTEATALDAASDTFGSVQLGVGFGSVFLDAGVGADPDVVAAAAALRATGATDGRFFSVRYKSFEVNIVDDVAALADPDYVGAEVMQAFVEAWNGPAG